MRRLVSILFVAAALGGSPVLAADFDAGMAAARARDFATALAEWKPLADAGDARAQINLAQMYEGGNGVPLDLAEAARLYRAAADGGHPNGQVRYAMVLQSGQGVARDKSAAVEWLMKSAEQRNPEAIYELGYAYHEGEGVAVGLVEAMKWFIIADDFRWAAAYPAGTYTADKIGEAGLNRASEAAEEWLAAHPQR